MANQSLVDLTSRTATSDTDLIHVNSGGSDYKQSKGDFLKGGFNISLSNTASITSSAESLPTTGTYFGVISSYGHQSETGVPENANYYFKIQKSGNNYINLEVWNVNNVESAHYIKSKVGGTWGDWVKVPTRSEISSLNNNLTQCLITHYATVVTGTHTISGLLQCDLVIFARNATGLYVILNGGNSAYNLIDPVAISNVSMSNGTMTFTRTSAYSGEVIVISRSRNVTIS